MKRIPILAALLLLSCSPLDKLEAVVAAGEAALISLEAAGQISPQTAAEVLNDLDIASADVIEVTGIIASTESPTQKTLEILGAFNNIPIPSDAAAIYFASVQIAIRTFLANYRIPGANARVMKALTPSEKDLTGVAGIKARAIAFQLKLATVKR